MGTDRWAVPNEGHNQAERLNESERSQRHDARVFRYLRRGDSQRAVKSGIFGGKSSSLLQSQQRVPDVRKAVSRAKPADAIGSQWRTPSASTADASGLLP